MKKIVFVFSLLIATSNLFAQETYTVNGESLTLKTEIEGKLDLLWTTVNNEYRYFIRTSDGTLTELKNTRNADRTYNEEYKSVLSQLTSDQNASTDDVKLTLYSLKRFIDDYNAASDTSYSALSEDKGLLFRLGFSGGVTNNPFVGNPDNKLSLLIGGELELLESKFPRHAGFFQVRHAFENDDFMYSTTELSLGYRYRVINKECFNIYGQFKFATVNFTNATVIGENDVELEVSDTAFDIPFIFGVGADIKVSENSYITIIYSELFAILLDNQGNFSTDISIGYKFNL